MLIRDSELDSSIHIDYVPLVDVLFNLLIFFLLATTLAQAEREMNIALPAAAHSGPVTRLMREIVVNVDARGRIIINGKETEPDVLREMIKNALTLNPDQKVTVRGDKDVPYAAVVRALDVCKAAGIQEPFLDTVPTH
jgi:biopolymer transport protein ExbD